MAERLPKYTIDELYFEEMTEDEAVARFKEGGYNKYKKRINRYEILPKEGAFASKPAKMFMVFNKETHKPMGVVGFSIYSADLLLGAGLHVRIDERERGLAGYLVDKLIEEKGGRTLITIFTSDRAFNAYTKRGFKPVEEVHLPDDIRNDIEAASKGSTYQGTLEKFLMLKDNWFLMLKRN
jgi:N-acetylglutamate synthase-like GNAT family acetyltransferase